VEVVLAGASGLIGSALGASLRADGHRVKTLVRRPAPGPDFDSWDPTRGRLDPDFLRGADAVVCLSGVGVGDHRWTDAYKQAILSSRIDSVGTVARSLAEYGGPRVLLAASAIGYYGDTDDREVDEDAAAGDSFLSEVCVEWEAAADPAREAGVRVSHLRSASVLARGGGFLKRLVPIVKAGVAGRLGSGRQYFPWISLTDEVAAIRFLLEHEIAGPVNLVSPGLVTNRQFTDTLGEVLRRRTVLPVPGLAARIVLGELGTEVLSGQRALPTRLREAGFEFTHPDLETALRAELAR
jgi:uncharacterized protein (TIGR01777 family)